jgi:hypothetical protein
VIIPLVDADKRAGGSRHRRSGYSPRDAYRDASTFPVVVSMWMIQNASTSS